MTALNTDETREAFLAAGTPAQGARVLDVPGKWLRDILRNTLHVHVSRGGVYDDATRNALYDAAFARIAKRTASVTPTDATDAPTTDAAE
jgi:hypothetical protein